jgi:hypothetical protein
MSAYSTAKVDKVLREVFANGRGEAGLEVGTDPGLPADEYIQIPECMFKQWCAELTDSEWVRYKKAKHREDESFDLDLAKAEYSSRPGAMVGKPGWVSSGNITVHEGLIYTSYDGVLYELEEVKRPDCSASDLEMFVQANINHIRDSAFDPQTHKWIHACRFWAVVAGFVTTSKSKEWTRVANPASVSDHAKAIAEFVADYSANAWTASAARAASWRKSNHATGGSIVQGFPRKWLQRMNYIVPTPDGAAKTVLMRMLTDAFYIATHASSVHAVLALQVPDDTNHWASIDPSCGMIDDWDIGTSAKIRMAPNTQVAGTAIVTDAVVVLTMMVKEGIAPLLNNTSQVEALVQAFKVVDEHGIACASYAKWFLDGHPERVSAIDFGQKDASYSDLLGELAAVGTKYYQGSTIGEAASLKNAVSQLASPETVATWTTIAASRKRMTGSQIIEAMAAIKGGSTAGVVTKVLAVSEDIVREGVEEYNAETRRIAALVKSSAHLEVSADRVLDNKRRATGTTATTTDST